MSEYCYQCTGCGRFSDGCICETGFKDPMECWKSMSESELLNDLEEPNII